jgi:hypothetical protein
MKAQQALSLAGAWDFATGDETPVAYSDYVMLPGSMLTNGKGDLVNVKTQWTGSLYDSSYFFNPYMEKYRVEGQMKFPFFLTPERHYVGRAWYERNVIVPKSWKGRRVILFLERPHIETTVTVNNHAAGHQLSLSVPHEYDLTPYIVYGGENTISIEVYNGIENVGVGQDSHSVTDQTQGNWNGIAGRMELQARAKNSIRQLRVYPDVKEMNIQVAVKKPHDAKIKVWVEGRKAVVTRDSAVILPMAGAQLWDEFTPQLYTLFAVCDGDTVHTTFGMRQMTVDGSQLLLNGKPVWMRGTVGNCCFPETGYPPTDEVSWERILRKCKSYGINHVRFHSYCPPEAAFNVADRLGLYLQPEGPSWPNHGVKLRRGMPIDQYLLDEGRRMLDVYGNHPSFTMMAAGNEPAGDWVAYCRDWVKAMKDYDPTRIYCGASVGGGWAWDDGSEYHVKAGARGLDWDKQAPHSDDDYYQQLLFPRNYKGTEPNRSPIIAHEQGQWCAFPDFKEIPQYTGVYKARNFELFQDLLRDHGMQSQAEHFLMSSGRLQVLCYKYEIERNLRTQDYAGFQLLALNDYSGQGTALVGPLNVHWLEKGYCTADDWTQFCAPVVPLAKFPKFVFTDTDIDIPIDVYNAWKEPLRNARISWTVEGMDMDGRSEPMTLQQGRNANVLTIHPALSDKTLATPKKLKLVVTVTSDNALAFHNSWEYWVYPQQMDMPVTTVYETDTLDSSAIDVLQNGGDVLLTAAGKVRYGNDVKHSFLPVFWNTSWFKMRPPHTTGAYIDSRHPVFRHFPTDDWQNLNWWELTNRAQVMNLSEFPKAYQPMVQPIDTWHVSRKLGMLVEARVLKGRLLMTTMDISHALDTRPVARQLRYSILKYMDSPDFKPTTTVPVATIRHLYECEAPKVDMFTNESPDELKPKLNN